MKKSLRQNALAYRRQLKPEEVTAMEREITVSLFTLLQTLDPCTVGLFYPTRGEPNILPIVGNPGLSGFDWALPVCCGLPTSPVLQFAQYQEGAPLEIGAYEIPVPTIKHWVQPKVLLIPCLAFHRTGARLGYGAGWYDRTLSQFDIPPVAVGVAYSNTELSENFVEPHDQLLNYLVTEQTVIVCSVTN